MGSWLALYAKIPFARYNQNTKFIYGAYSEDHGRAEIRFEADAQLTELENNEGSRVIVQALEERVFRLLARDPSDLRCADDASPMAFGPLPCG